MIDGYCWWCLSTEKLTADASGDDSQLLVIKRCHEPRRNMFFLMAIMICLIMTGHGVESGLLWLFFKSYWYSWLILIHSCSWWLIILDHDVSDEHDCGSCIPKKYRLRPLDNDFIMTMVETVDPQKMLLTTNGYIPKIAIEWFDSRHHVLGRGQPNSG